MALINIETIKSKLIDFGIEFSKFQEITGNLVGNVVIPTKLLLINKDLTVEAAFYLVANKVFEAANLYCYNVPNQFYVTKAWKEVVGNFVFDTFKSAIFEEVSQRFLSNYFPEFEKENLLVSNNVNVNFADTSTDTVSEYLNALTKAKLDTIDWLSIDVSKQNDPKFNKEWMYANLSNLNLPTNTEKQFIMVGEDGSRHLEAISNFATIAQINEINKNLSLTGDAIANNTSYINSIKPTMDDVATKRWVSTIMTSTPEVDNWNSSTTYMIPTFVVHDGKLWFSMRDNNLNKIPGGISGDGWWQQIIHIVDNKSGEIVFAAGTEIKYSYSCPNNNYFVNVIICW